MGNRAAATAFILEHIGMIDPDDTQNVEIKRKELESLSDSEFREYMRKISRLKEGESDEGRETLTYYAPNLAKTKISVKRNLEIAKKIGHEFFERLWITDPQTGVTYLTVQKHMVVDMTIRRQAQLQIKKSSIPLDQNSVDELSGQPTGASKGGKVSFPEIQAQASQELDQTIIEEIKIRGGDEKAYREFEKKLIDNGTVSQTELLAMGTRTKSTETLSKLFMGMHLDNNLAE